MKPRFILFKRAGVFYSEDTTTRKQHSLRTKDEAEALTLLHSKNEAHRQPMLNMQIAKAYIAGTDSGINSRTWQQSIDAVINTKQGKNKERWQRVVKDKALTPLLPRVVIETQGEFLLRVLQSGTVSTNVYLRRLHNFCLDMNWLPWPLIPKRQWPAVRFKDKRAITYAEHCRIVERERNPERKAYYQLVWHIGASQSDLANLHAEDIDWQMRVICFERMKIRWRNLTPPQISFGKEVEAILSTLPKTGPLFPHLATVRESDRATEFKQRCDGLGIEGVTLHSYRYSWAERAATAGYPERYAQKALGHNSKAWARAYSKKAQVTLPPLEEYERKIVPLPAKAA